MRVVSFVLLIGVACASPARAQTPTGTWEVGLGPHIVLRENFTTHNGGGITVARRFQRLAAVFEANGTRREGHNDWRLVGGPRFTLGTTARSAFFAQVLAGTLIRSRAADWAVLPGIGADVRWADWSTIRFQIDAPIERSDSRTAESGRASVFLIFH